MAVFIIGCIIGLMGLVLLIFAKPLASGADNEAGTRLRLRVTSGICLLMFTGLWAITGLKSVPVKNIGVPQAFGAVEGGYWDPGTHETWEPWLHLTDINETVQTTTFEVSSGDVSPESDQCAGGLPVRIGGQQSACANVTIQWQIKDNAAGRLFSDYANQGDLMTEITNAVVIRELKQDVNIRLGDYNPITDVQAVAGSNSATSQFTVLSRDVFSDMQADIGNRITVLAVLLPKLTYDSQTQAKLDAIQQAYANDQIARENITVNQDQAKAYQQLKSPSATALLSQCLGYMDDLIKAGKAPPVGMCNLSGSFSAIAGG